MSIKEIVEQQFKQLIGHEPTTAEETGHEYARMFRSLTSSRWQGAGNVQWQQVTATERLVRMWCPVTIDESWPEQEELAKSALNLWWATVYGYLQPESGRTLIYDGMSEDQSGNQIYFVCRARGIIRTTPA